MTVLQSGRVAAEARMTVTVAAYAPSGTTKDAGGYDVPGYVSKGSFPARFAARDAGVSAVDLSDVERDVRTTQMHLPISSPAPTVGKYRQGWEYEVTAVGVLDDPALLGTRWLVTNSPIASNATARRLFVHQL